MKVVFRKRAHVIVLIVAMENISPTSLHHPDKTIYFFRGKGTSIS